MHLQWNSLHPSLYVLGEEGGISNPPPPLVFNGDGHLLCPPLQLSMLLFSQYSRGKTNSMALGKHTKFKDQQNRKIPSETISGQNQSQWLVYKYNKSDMGPFKVLICPAGSGPKSNLSVVDIRRMLGKLGIGYRRIFQDSRWCWTVLFSSRNMANIATDWIGIKEKKLGVFIPAREIVKKRITRGIPLDISNEELLERIRHENPSPHVTGSKWLQILQKNIPVQGTEAGENNGCEAKEKAWVDSKLVCLDFKSHSLPNEVVAWNAILKITPSITAIKLL